MTTVVMCAHVCPGQQGCQIIRGELRVKSQMKSIYRKLDATIRNQAVMRARDLGFLEG
jgi:hypothetical protein